MGKSSFGWTPKKVENIDIGLEKELFIPVCHKVFGKLEWDVVYTDDTNVEAKAKTNKQWSEKIIVEWNPNKLKVTSITLGNQMWDAGKNSKRIEAFGIKINEYLKELNSTKKKELLEEVKKEKSEWENYQIPLTLPDPPGIPKINSNFFFLMILICSIILGGIYGMGKRISHIIILYEVLISLGYAFGLGLFLNGRRFNVFKNMKIQMIIGAILIVFISEFTLYLILILENNAYNLSIIDFFKYRFEKGMKINGTNIGSIGLTLSWVLSVVVIYFLGTLNFNMKLFKHILEITPKEVQEMLFHMACDNKDELTMKGILTKRGWINEDDQCLALEALGVQIASMQMARSDKMK